MTIEVDVLCVGIACHDLIFSVERHPAPDEKVFAGGFHDCGGGPAANAAVAAARLGAACMYAGYLGNDLFGRKHLEELTQDGVRTDLVVTGDAPTPLSAILVKPDGRRTVVNFKGATGQLAADAVDFDRCRPRVVLFDGHQLQISKSMLDRAMANRIPTVLDAGSVHEGTRYLAGLVDYLVASDKFARQFSGQPDAALAARHMQRPGSAVIVTLGDAGLVWRTDAGAGSLPAHAIDAVDTTGAGDAFHGAFAAGLAAGLGWADLLRYASAAAALCCRKYGARPGMPRAEEVKAFLRRNP